MHGIIFTGLKQFVVEASDEGTWKRIREEAGVGKVRYTPAATYPDEDFVALVDAAVELSGTERSDLLRRFGRHVVAMLVDTYGVYIDDDWSGLDLVENVEEAIRKALRNGEPPAIFATRLDEEVVVVRYGSRRGLCAVAMGLLEGVGDHYDETLKIYERSCQHDGAPQCEIVAVSRTTSRRRAERLIEREYVAG